MLDSNYYLKMNPDVAAAVARGETTAEQHYNLYGRFENRAPSPFFDPVLYAQANPDVANAVRDGLISSLFDHFTLYGQDEGRTASLFFDANVYLAANPDVAAAIANGLIDSAWDHFLAFGQNEVRNTSQYFDLKDYLEANPDVAAAVQAGTMTAFDHFLNFGFQEGRNIGNGISLSNFANDPAAQEAIANGDIGALMARVAEIAPFLPDYQPPAGYTIPSDQPIPQDFVPVEGTHLVIPEGVEIPEGTELPPAFENVEEPVNPGPGTGPTPDPVDTGTPDYGKVLAKQSDGTLWVGEGNSADNFNITRTNLSNVELALKGYIRKVGDVTKDDQDSIYEFTRDDEVGFAYSVASLGSRSIGDLITKDGYSFHLKIDNDSGNGFGDHSSEFELKVQESSFPSKEKINDSGLNWVLKGSDVTKLDGNIVDDQGSIFITQNIQTPLWYGAMKQPGSTVDNLLPGDYSVSLEMRKGGSTVATQEITLKVGPDYSIDSTTADVLHSKATKDGEMFVGGGNPSNNFSVVRIDAYGDSTPDIEIALGGQKQYGPEIYKLVDGHFEVPDTHIPTFKYSVASLTDIELADLLKTYDIKLYVDTDKTDATNFITLSAVAPTSGENTKPSPGALAWEFADDYSSYKLKDDQGNANVSQNIQALSWYQPDDGKLFAGSATTIAEGEYTVRLEVLQKGTTTLIGFNEVVFDVVGSVG